MCLRCDGSASGNLPCTHTCSVYTACVYFLCVPVPSSCQSVYTEQYHVMCQHHQFFSLHAALPHASQDSCVHNKLQHSACVLQVGRHGATHWRKDSAPPGGEAEPDAAEDPQHAGPPHAQHICEGHGRLRKHCPVGRPPCLSSCFSWLAPWSKDKLQCRTQRRHQ